MHNTRPAHINDIIHEYEDAIVVVKDKNNEDIFTFSTYEYDAGKLSEIEKFFVENANIIDGEWDNGILVFKIELP